MRRLEEMQFAAAPCAYAAQPAASEVQRTSPSRTRVFAIVCAVQALLTFGLVAAARAGPCTQEIEAVQAQVDAVLGANAAAGPTEPESRSALLNRQPTPESIARAEQKAGEGTKSEHALAALAIARAADQAGDADRCHAAVNDARRAIAR